ncbi:MAG: hypothetical protein ONB44_13835 [candidate division KSB1 bacterium]|nr:hypothetical protein [candidate division KSB1 bacterium]MDZ7303205.1 hypothetical protein [candidate division KSB1 bacterium]MDZ7312183.1 hypothetical protein [candidate division KSB1 bacterium]
MSKIGFGKISLIFFIAGLWQLVIAGESGELSERKLLTSPPAALVLQTNHLQLTPKGTLQVQTAFEFRSDWQAPITHARGDLYRLGVMRFDFGLADHVTLQIRGAIRQELRCAKKTLADGAATAHDVGDFSVATLARLLPAGKFHPALGFRIETKLPNTNQDRGIGTNTTDVTMSVLATKQYGSALVFTDVGIGILTAPRQINDQNDVMVYGLGVLWKISNQFQIAGEINGFTSPRQQIPVGTEDRSAARLGVNWRLPKFSLELLAVNGLTRREGGLGFIAGLSWQVNMFSTAVIQSNQQNR